MSSKPPDGKISEVFDAVWVVLQRILRGTMTAAIVQRAIEECGAQCKNLRRAVIEKSEGQCKYTIPAEAEKDPESLDPRNAIISGTNL